MPDGWAGANLVDGNTGAISYKKEATDERQDLSAKHPETLGGRTEKSTKDPTKILRKGCVNPTKAIPKSYKKTYKKSYKSPQVCAFVGFFVGFIVGLFASFCRIWLAFL